MVLLICIFLGTLFLYHEIVSETNLLPLNYNLKVFCKVIQLLALFPRYQCYALEGRVALETCTSSTVHRDEDFIASSHLDVSWQLMQMHNYTE